VDRPPQLAGPNEYLRGDSWPAVWATGKEGDLSTRPSAKAHARASSGVGNALGRQMRLLDQLDVVCLFLRFLPTGLSQADPSARADVTRAAWALPFSRGPAYSGKNQAVENTILNRLLLSEFAPRAFSQAPPHRLADGPVQIVSATY
jgi:hypothetical protein